MDIQKTREELRTEFYAAFEAAMKLRPLYSAMHEDDKVELVQRYPNPDRSISGIFTAPLNVLFDLCDRFRNDEVLK